LKLDLETNSLLDILRETSTIAKEASRILRSFSQNSSKIVLQPNDKEGPVTSADLAANQYILEQLQSIFGLDQCAYLSEETHSGNQAFPQAWVWIIDPLDGTKDFLQKTGEYAIHIALAYQGRPVVAVVALPELEKIYCAVRGQGSYVENAQGKTSVLQVSTCSDLSRLSLVVSRNHRDERFQKLIEALPLKSRHYVGSVGCKIAALVEQQADVYISLSGKSAPKDWDFAAPELILTEAGGQLTYLDGSPLLYNQGDVSQWGALIASNGPSHPELLEKTREILQQIDN